MKRILLLAVAATITTASFSQVKLGAQVTGNAGSVSTDAPAKIEKSMRGGFGAGVVSEIPLGSNFSLRPSINFLQKGSSFKSVPVIVGEGSSAKADLQTTLNYLELPVLVQYTVPLNKMNLFFAAGPSLGYGISGKIKLTTTGTVEGQPVNTTDKINAFKSEDKDGAGMKRFDISANAIAGLEFENGMFVHAGYLGSLKSITEESKYKNYGFQLTLGYFFKK